MTHLTTEYYQETNLMYNKTWNCKITDNHTESDYYGKGYTKNEAKEKALNTYTINKTKKNNNS